MVKKQKLTKKLTEFTKCDVKMEASSVDDEKFGDSATYNSLLNILDYYKNLFFSFYFINSKSNRSNIPQTVVNNLSSTLGAVERTLPALETGSHLNRCHQRTSRPSGNSTATAKSTSGTISSPTTTAKLVTNMPFNCIYTNATSLNSPSKKADLQIRTCLSTDIIFVTETWYHALSDPQLANFKFFKKDRNGKGGGVIIYTKDNLYSSELTDPALRRNLCEANNAVEQVWCEVSRDPSDRKLLLGCIYRPPLNSRTSQDKLLHTQTIDFINKSISIAAKAIENELYDGLCLAGDFNFPDLKWSSDMVLNCGKPDGPAGTFLDTLNGNSLHQAVRDPTFFNSLFQPTNVLDLIISDRAERTDIISIDPPLGSTSQGHGVIHFSLNVNSNRNIIPSFRSTPFNFTKGNYNGLKTKFKNTDWKSELNIDNIDQMFEKFLSIYQRLCNKHIPKHKPSLLNKNPPWLTGELKKLTIKKNDFSI